MTNPDYAVFKHFQGLAAHVDELNSGLFKGRMGLFLADDVLAVMLTTPECPTEQAAWDSLAKLFLELRQAFLEENFEWAWGDTFDEFRERADEARPRKIRRVN